MAKKRGALRSRETLTELRSAHSAVVDGRSGLELFAACQRASRHRIKSCVANEQRNEWHRDHDDLAECRGFSGRSGRSAFPQFRDQRLQLFRMARRETHFVTGVDPQLPRLSNRSFPLRRFRCASIYFPDARMRSMICGLSGSRPDRGSRGVSSRHSGSIRKARAKRGSDSSTRPMLTSATACQ